MRTRTSLMRAFLLFVLVLPMVLASGCGQSSKPGGTSATGEDSSRWTQDQQMIVTDFGSPQAYTVVFGEDPEDSSDLETHRYEYWEYYDAGVVVEFIDGVLTGESDLQVFAEAPAGGLRFVEVTPDRFTVGMSVDEVSQALGEEPDDNGNVAPEDLEGTEVYTWSDAITAVFYDGGLAGIEVRPVPAEGGAS